MATYRVTGTWGSGHEHASPGEERELPDGGERMTAHVRPPTDKSAITGTYFLERVDPPIPSWVPKGPGGELAVPCWFCPHFS